MRYFVAYLLEGEAGQYHENLTQTLAECFGVVPLHERVPPHITLKAPFDAAHSKPFEADDISDVDATLRTFAKRAAVSDVRLKGFGCFGSRVVYMDVLPSPEMEVLVRELHEALKGVSWLSFNRNEHSQRFHASLARFLTPRQFAQVWNYVQTRKEPRFDLLFDHVALMRHTGRRWEVEKVHQFTV